MITLPTDDDARGWEALRHALFPGDRLNLNPGTLGTPSTPVRRAIADFQENNAGYPLGQYIAGRQALRAARARAAELWGDTPAVVGSTTHTMNLLTLLLPRVLGSSHIRVLTTLHEHHGGAGGFEHDPAYDVRFFSTEELADPERARARILAERPAVLLVSQRAWTDGARLPVDTLVPTAREALPDCVIVVDAAQSLGLEPPALLGLPDDKGPDLVVASAHKWLFGPPGAGFVWVRPAVRDRLHPWRAGEPLDPDSPLSPWEAAGGQDFGVYAGVHAALDLYACVGPERVRERSGQLAAWLATALGEVLPDAGVDAVGGVVRVRTARDPYPLYAALNERGIHTKCVKMQVGADQLALLRVGVPWYETTLRLSRFVATAKELGGG